MWHLWRHRFRRGTLWLVFCVGVIAGLGLKLALPGLALVALLAVSSSWRTKGLFLLFSLLILGLALGAGRGPGYKNRLAVYQALYYHSITLSGSALSDGIYAKRGQLAFDVDHLHLGGVALPGKIQVSGFGTNAAFQGDVVKVRGKLYPGYGSYQGRISFAKVNVTARHVSWVSWVRQKFTAGIQTALPEPLAPFAMGLLVGQRANLPDGVKQDLLMVGLTHIIAVSGYNLTIILHASRKLLAKHSKRLSTGLSLGLILVFLLLAGASASIIRAAIVSMLSILTSYYGRSFQPLTLIAMAAAITAWINPPYLWGDLSWYLSFLAFFGVMVLAPLIQIRWPGRWHQTVVGGVALESVCAEIMSLPFILHEFGQMSLVGLVANVLVTSLIPLAMLLSVIAGFGGTLVPALSGWLAWPAKLLLDYMLDAAHVLAVLPHVFLQGIGLGLGQMLLLYGCVALLVALLWFKKPLKSAIVTDKNVRSQQMVHY